MAQTILVTGGAGYIGSHTIVELIGKGFEVVVVDNYSNSSPVCLQRVEQIVGKKVTAYRCDIRDEKSLDQIFAKHKFDAVIHFAGLKAVGESCTMPVEYYDNNVYGTVVLLKVMKRFGVKKIVFSSSATVYGNPEKLPISEDCALRTTNPYGETKLAIENMLRSLYNADKKWCITLLRYFNPVGAHESGLIGEDPKGVPNNLTPYIAKVASGALPCLNIYGNDYPTKDGTGVRDYIHITDLARGHIDALSHSEGGVYTYNLGTGVGYSVMDVLHSFEKACGHAIPYKFVGRRDGDVAICFADPTKAFRELGWKAELGIDEMCASLWNWQMKNPNGFES